MPITWQNIRGLNLAETGRPLEAAQRGLDSMFDKFGNILKQNENTDTANWQTGKVNNTNAALNAINQYDSPEAFQAAQKAGAIQALLGGYGAQADQQAIRTALDGRMGILQQRAKQGFEYQNAVTDQTNAPIEDQFRAAAIAEDKPEMDRLQAIYAGRNRAGLLEFKDGREQLGVTRKRDDTRFQWDGQDQRMQVATHGSNMATDRLQRGLISAQTSAAKTRAEVELEELELRRTEGGKGKKGESALLDKRFQEEIANGPLSMGTYGTKEGTKAFLDGLKNFPGMTPDDAKDILYNVSEKYSKGITVMNGEGKDAQPVTIPVPISMIMEEMGGAQNTNNLPFWGSNRGAKLIEKINKRFGLDKNGRIDPEIKSDRVTIDKILRANEIYQQRSEPLTKKYGSEQQETVANPFATDEGGNYKMLPAKQGDRMMHKGKLHVFDKNKWRPL